MARWFAMSTRFLKDPKVRRVIRSEGNDAVPVFLALLSEAMLQESGGHVELTYDQLAMDGFTDEDRARAIVQGGHETGFLVLDEGDDFEFHLHFPAWSRHQASYRKAKSREARKPNGQANVTPSHAEVTPGHKKSPTGQDSTRQDKTGEKKETLAPLTRDHFPLSFLIADLRSQADPDGKTYEPTRTWAVEEERMLRIDGRDPVKAEALIRWVWTEGNFWRGKVGNTKKFRSKYQQLHEDAVADWRKKNRGSEGVDQAHRFAERAKKLKAQEAA